MVVTGGAYGIEGAVHQAALAAGGDTIAILAGGVDRPYPAGHRDLLDRVADVGTLVGEVLPGAVPTRHRFIARARLLVALSFTMVVVEASARSGSLVVAQCALVLGRGVGAVPGPVTSATNVGPRRLLWDGTASLVADTSDLAHLAERGTGHRVSISRAQIKADRLRATTPALSHTSKDTISRITDRVVEEMNSWVARSLEPIYAAIFIDAIVVKVRDEQVRN